MPITNPEWESISQMIDAIVRRVVGTRADFFTTGKVVKVDPINKCVYLAEFGDQPIPITGFDRTVTYYYENVQNESRHFIGASGEPAFQGNWHNYDATNWPKAAFWKDAFGLVHLEGLVSNAPSGGVTDTMWTFPVGYRPVDPITATGQALIGGHCFNSAANSGRIADLRVSLNGNIAQSGTAGTGVDTGGWLALDSCTPFDSGIPLANKVIRKAVTAGVVMPKVGESVLVVREMGTRRLPRAIGVIQGKNWIVAEEE